MLLEDWEEEIELPLFVGFSQLGKEISFNLILLPPVHLESAPTSAKIPVFSHESVVLPKLEFNLHRRYYSIT
jgi:hypothetical protein